MTLTLAELAPHDPITISIASAIPAFSFNRSDLATNYTATPQGTSSFPVISHNCSLMSGGPAGVSSFCGNGNNQVIASAGNANFVLSGTANTSGLFIIGHSETGKSALVYFCYPQGLTIMNQSSAGFFQISTTPTSGLGIEYVSSTNVLTVYNTTGANATIRVTALSMS